MSLGCIRIDAWSECATAVIDSRWRGCGILGPPYQQLHPNTLFRYLYGGNSDQFFNASINGTAALGHCLCTYHEHALYRSWLIKNGLTSSDNRFILSYSLILRRRMQFHWIQVWSPRLLLSASRLTLSLFHFYCIVTAYTLTPTTQW